MDWKNLNQNFYQEEHHKPEVIKEWILVWSEAIKKAPKIEGVPTGVKWLDELFFTVEIDENGKIVKKPLWWIPRYSVFNITWAPDTWKSLMAEQFAIAQAARWEKVAFITVESPAVFVVSWLKQRAAAMWYRFEELEDNIILIDAASHSKLREIPDLLATLAYAIKTYKISYTVIDSITWLYENKEMMARAIVRRLFNFMKKWYQTAWFISQKRSGHEELSAEAAWGFAVGHIVDWTMVLAKEVIMTSYQARLYKKQIWDIVRLFRIDWCRMSGHDTKIHYLYITDTWLVEIGEPIGK